MKPHIHADSSVKQFGGKAEDYLPIHEFLDSSKSVVADHRHRALTHNTWFIMYVLPRVFGETITNSDGKKVSVRDIGEQHVLEDFRGKFIPSAQDWLQSLKYEKWMNNGEAGFPPSEIGRMSGEDQLEELKKLLKEARPVIPNTPIQQPYPVWPPWDDKGGWPNKPEIID